MALGSFCFWLLLREHIMTKPCCLSVWPLWWMLALYSGLILCSVLNICVFLLEIFLSVPSCNEVGRPAAACRSLLFSSTGEANWKHVPAKCPMYYWIHICTAPRQWLYSLDARDNCMMKNPEVSNCAKQIMKCNGLNVLGVVSIVIY